MIKCLTAYLALFTAAFATQLTVQLIPQEHCVDLIPSKPTLIVSGDSVDGRSLFSTISNHIISIIPVKNVTFECLDFKFMNNEDLCDVSHYHMFVNKGTLDILVQGSQLGNGTLHINLSLPPYIPIDEHLLFPPFQSAFGKMCMSAQVSAFTRLSRLMKNTFLLPEDHNLLIDSNRSDALELEEKIWMLEFGTLSMLIHLKGRLQELRNINPDLYLEVFPNPIELTTDISPRLYLHYRAECDKHLAHHFLTENDLLSFDLNEKSSVVFQLQRELDIITAERNELNGQIKGFRQAQSELVDNMKQARDANIGLGTKLDRLKADSESIAVEKEKLYQQTKGLHKAKRQLEANLQKLITETESTNAERNQLKNQVQQLRQEKRQLAASLKQTNNEKIELGSKLKNLVSESEIAAKDNQKNLNDLAEKDLKVAELQNAYEEKTLQVEVLQQKTLTAEETIKNVQASVASQKVLIAHLHTSCELGVSVTNLIDMPDCPEDMQKMMKWTHAAARFEYLGELSAYDESNLAAPEKRVMRKLWLETYYSEGIRLRNWLALAKTNDWRDVFLFEACYTSVLDEHDEEKIKRKLGKMKTDITRLENRIIELIAALQQKAKDATTEHDDIKAFTTAALQHANSSLDVELYIKAFSLL